MTGQERRDKILGILEERGMAKVNELATSLLVSEKSIRRDLQELENKGLLVRIRGGAMKKEDTQVSVNQMKFEISEEASVRIADVEELKAPIESEAAPNVEQARVVRTSRPDWLVKAIEKKRPGTIVEPVAPVIEEKAKPTKVVKAERPAPPPVKEAKPAPPAKKAKPAPPPTKAVKPPPPSAEEIKPAPPATKAKPVAPKPAPEPEKPKKDLDVIEVGTSLKAEALEELRKLADPSSHGVLPAKLDEATWKGEEPEVPAEPLESAPVEEPSPKKREERKDRQASKKRSKKKGKPVPAAKREEARASEPTASPKPKKADTGPREDKKRKPEELAKAKKKPAKAKKKPEIEEEAPKEPSRVRKIIDVIHIVVALVCFIGGTALAIYILFGDRVGGEGADTGVMQELVTHEELSFYVPENWRVLDGGGSDTVLRIRGRQGDIIGAMTISTHDGDTGSTLEANFDRISARVHQGMTYFQSDVIQFGNTPTRRHSYTDQSGDREASLNTFLIPSGDRIKYIQLRKPIDGFNQELLEQFNEIVRSMNFLPSEFARE